MASGPASGRTVTLDTSEGLFTVELYEEYAPQTCKNFAALAEGGKYDGTLFHRLVPD